ncbi:MAG: DUF2442 domain-containing protein [Chloroflexi bacterium]|nr:MAG: DUF2442 domain-containing protein [Chloroflexota bacterium]
MSEKLHQVDIVKADDTYLYLNVDGQAYRVRWSDCSSKLTEASQIERQYIEVSPSGYGLHWPLIDENLAITPLLKQAEKLTAESV